MKTLVVLIIIFVVITGFLFFLFCGISQEPYGYWKPDKEAEQQAIRELRVEFPENLWNIKIQNYEGSLNAPHSRVTEISYEGAPMIDSEITEVEAKQIAINFISDHLDFFGIESINQVEIKEIKDRWEIIFDLQKYQGIVINEPLDYSGFIELYPDGQVERAVLGWFENVSVPSSQKLSDKEIGEDKGFGPECEPASIYPVWHPEGGYWTYHLVKNCGGHYVDTQTGEVFFEYRPIP